MDRRSFFATLAGTTAALAVPSVAAPATRPDTFTYGGWQVCWSGWRDMPNQYVRLGWWQALAMPAHPLMPYATTLGLVDVAHDTQVLDLTRVDRDAPLNPGRHSPAEFDAAKHRACQNLLQRLEAMAHEGRA